MSITEIPLVSRYQQVANNATQSSPADALTEVRRIRQEVEGSPSAHSSALDTAFRKVFVELIAVLDIENDDFSQVWSLLDAINLLSDNECCESAQGFWMIEDLLDAQTINGCRHVFNYLESRRERMTKINLQQKSLTILRCCNELLRRLSRAEDTVFCGRVFIYLFQSFPLGDKSSVNLRGEFHVENVTVYDEPGSRTSSVDDDENRDEMEMDNPSNADKHNSDMDKLYPVFWSLQSLFSSPTRLFEAGTMQRFKSGIRHTLDFFNQIHSSTKSSSLSVRDPERRGRKRKRETDSTEPQTEQNTSTFNPKYLTNRDLFDLEVHDIEFRRHMLVQSLILLDFLLSLTPQAKSRFTGLTRGKSIMSSLYDKFTLNEEDKAWVLETRKNIEKLLEEGNGAEGRYYLRMVNMVLSRDRNWTFWKADGCPAISRPSVEPETAMSSQQSLAKLTKSATLPLTRPKGSMQLQFLSESALQNGSGSQVPTLDEYHKSIVTDDLDLDFATDSEKKEIEERKAGKMWRALRSAHGRRFALCEDIKHGTNIDALVQKPHSIEEDTVGDEVIANAENDDTPMNGDGNAVETVVVENGVGLDDTAADNAKGESEAIEAG